MARTHHLSFLCFFLGGINLSTSVVLIVVLIFWPPDTNSRTQLCRMEWYVFLHVHYFSSEDRILANHCRIWSVRKCSYFAEAFLTSPGTENNFLHYSNPKHHLSNNLRCPVFYSCRKTLN